MDANNIRHLNPKEKTHKRIKKEDKNFVKKVDYTVIAFPVQIKDIPKIEKQNEIKINVFGYENKQSFALYISSEKFKNHMELLLIADDENFNQLCLTKQKVNITNIFDVLLAMLQQRRKKKSV